MNYRSFQCLQTLTGHEGGVKALTISPDGRILVSGSWDKTIKFWRMATGEEIQRWKPHRLAVTALAISPNGQILASGSRDKTVKICDIGKGQLLHTWASYAEEASQQIASVVFSRDGKTLYIGSEGGSAYYLDVETGKELGTLGPISTGCSHFALSRDGRTLAGINIGLLKVWELPQCKQRYRIETGQTTSSITISPDGRIIFIGDYEGKVNLWSASEGKQLDSLFKHSDIVKCLVVSANGQILASGGKDQSIILWDLSSKTQLCTLEGHSEDIMTLAFSPDGRTLVSGSMDSTIKIWGTP
jgi:WD40 repeat protein